MASNFVAGNFHLTSMGLLLPSEVGLSWLCSSPALGIQVGLTHTPQGGRAGDWTSWPAVRAAYLHRCSTVGWDTTSASSCPNSPSDLDLWYMWPSYQVSHRPQEEPLLSWTS